MICEILFWTLFGKEDIIEKDKLYKLLKIYPVTLKLTTSSHLSYDLARLMTWFGNGDYNYYIDNELGIEKLFNIETNLAHLVAQEGWTWHDE